MKLQPIIRVKLAKFREDYELQSVSDGIAFERFANQIILSTHQPGAFSVDDFLYYGFISMLPDNIFFHEQDNPGLSFSNLYAHEVLYSIKKDKNGNEKAIEVALI